MQCSDKATVVFDNAKILILKLITTNFTREITLLGCI